MKNWNFNSCRDEIENYFSKLLWRRVQNCFVNFWTLKIVLWTFDFALWFWKQKSRITNTKHNCFLTSENFRATYIFSSVFWQTPQTDLSSDGTKQQILIDYQPQTFWATKRMITSCLKRIVCSNGFLFNLYIQKMFYLLAASLIIILS